MKNLPAGLSKAQLASLQSAFTPNWMGETPKVCLWDGAIRSGKTVVSVLAFLVACKTPPPGGAIVVVGRTRDSIARNVFEVMQDPTLFGELASYVKYTSGASTAKIFGRTVHILGASDVRSEMVLRGLTVSLAYVDELTLISEPFWTQLLGRMSPPGSRIFATTNPDGPHHWAHRLVIKRIHQLGYKRFKFRLPANEWLMINNPQYVAQIDREYVGLWRRRFLDGDWVQAEGAIYDKWDEDVHVVPHDQIPKVDRVIMVGLDFGTTHPTRAYAVGIGPDWRVKRTPDLDPEEIPRVLYTLAEFAPETGLPIGKQSVEFQAWIRQIEKDWGRPEWVVVDPAAAHFRAQLFEDGIVNGPAHNSHGGVLVLASLLAVERLFVSSECKELIAHIPGYVWDPKATERGESVPLKENDDELDAWRYAVYSSRRFWREQVSVSVAQEHAPGVVDDEPDTLVA